MIVANRLRSYADGRQVGGRRGGETERNGSTTEEEQLPLPRYDARIPHDSGEKKKTFGVHVLFFFL